MFSSSIQTEDGDWPTNAAGLVSVDLLADQERNRGFCWSCAERLRSEFVDDLVIASRDPFGAGGASAILGLLVRFRRGSPDGAGVEERAFVVSEKHDGKNCGLFVLPEDSFGCSQCVRLECIRQGFGISACRKNAGSKRGEVDSGLDLDGLIVGDDELTALSGSMDFAGVWPRPRLVVVDRQRHARVRADDDGVALLRHDECRGVESSGCEDERDASAKWHCLSIAAKKGLPVSQRPPAQVFRKIRDLG